VSKKAEFKSVQYYSHHAQELKQTQKHKINKFLEFKCIVYDNINKVYLCKNIPGYNSRTYTLHNKTVDKSFCCNCQGFLATLKKTGRGTCSHVGALHEYFAINNKKRGGLIEE